MKIKVTTSIVLTTGFDTYETAREWVIYTYNNEPALFSDMIRQGSISNLEPYVEDKDEVSLQAEMLRKQL